MFSSADGRDRPTPIDIWLWQLEDVVTRNAVEHRKTEPSAPDSYDHFCLYAHHDCLKTPEDVQCTPDSVLFEALGLSGSVLGWLQFMTREHLWFSLISANWGHPTLRVGVDDLHLATEDQRHAEVVSQFLNLIRERGDNPVPDLRRLAETLRATLTKMRGEHLTSEEFAVWLREFNEWLYFIYVYTDKPNAPALLTEPHEPLYEGEFRASFAHEIRQAAERRRRYWNAPHSCDYGPRDEQS